MDPKPPISNSQGPFQPSIQGDPFYDTVRDISTEDDPVLESQGQQLVDDQSNYFPDQGRFIDVIFCVNGEPVGGAVWGQLSA